jgi:hypothetical protein
MMIDMKKDNKDTISAKEQPGQEQKDRTFIVKVKYDQNYSMQGSIQWVEKGKIVNFRSEMELLSLLSESINNKEFRSWEDDHSVLSILKNETS